MNIILNVEIRNGAEISQTCKETVEIAKNLNVVVKFEFNGVTCFARPTSDWERMVIQYQNELKSRPV